MVKNFLSEPVFGDPAIAALFESPALSRAMLEVEAALAEVQAGLGIIPSEAATAIAKTARALQINPAQLAEGVARSGVPVPALVKALRAELDQPHGDQVHWGATSQDIVDTALALRYRAALEILETRLGAVIDTLAEQSTSHAHTIMAARTRGQLATPTTLGLRIAQWAQPLIDCERDLGRVRERALRVQFGGASGNQAATAPDGPAIADGLARALGLSASPPWHTDRSGLRALAVWCSTLTSALGKIAQDMAILSRGEIAEAFGGTGGGSSTMPHKSNPVTAEAILSLAKLATVYDAGLAAASIHAEERDGAHWTVEWQLLPDLMVVCGKALAKSLVLVETLTADPEGMARRIAAAPEMMAEAAVFALSREFGRQKATALVTDAISRPEPLPEALAVLDPGPDWAMILDPAWAAEPSRVVAEQIFARRQRVVPDPQAPGDD